MVGNIARDFLYNLVSIVKELLTCYEFSLGLTFGGLSDNRQIQTRKSQQVASLAHQ